MENLISKLKDLKPEELEEIGRECINFLFSFLGSISDEENKKLKANMEEFIEEVKKIPLDKIREMGEEEKAQTIQKVVQNYNQKIFSALNRENQKRLKEGMEKIIERKLLSGLNIVKSQ